MDDNETLRAVGRLEGKVDMFIEMYKEDRVRASKNEERLSEVEKKQWYHSGVMAFAVMFLMPKLRTMLGL